MYTTRQLINESYRMSGMKGTGETPTSVETTEAKDLLNSILDTFAIQPSWAPGIITRTINTKPNGTAVIAKDLSRIITRIVATTAPDQMVITTADINKILINDLINISLNGNIYSVQVTAINSMFSFTTTNPTQLIGNYQQATFKLQSESDDYLIDLIIDPPSRLISVMSGSTPLPEIMAQDFYTNTDTYGWYYETATDPYPKLTISGSTQVVIAMEEPGYRNVTLDTDLSRLPTNMVQILKWRLAGDLAQINGFIEMSTSCLARYHEANATYRRSRHKAGDAVGDQSAPGTCVSGRYDIATDGSIYG